MNEIQMLKLGRERLTRASLKFLAGIVGKRTIFRIFLTVY